MRMTSGFELGGAFRILASSCPLFDLRPRMLVSHRFKSDYDFNPTNPPFALVLKIAQPRGNIAPGTFKFILSLHFSEKIPNLPPTPGVG